jgi:plasmid stability protein
VKQLTIRGLGDELHMALKQEASRRGLSMNRYVLLILRRAVSPGDERWQENVTFHDLDYLAGTWTEEEFQEFYKRLDPQRSTEEELWR